MNVRASEITMRTTAGGDQDDGPAQVVAGYGVDPVAAVSSLRHAAKAAARAIQDLSPDATVLVVTDAEGHEFVIAYGGINGDVSAMYRKRGFRVTSLAELEPGDAR